MTEETALVPVATENSPKELARAFAASGFFGDIHKVSQALVKIAAGQELGLGPMASMTGIHLIEGEISLGANLLAALIRRSDLYDYEILELTNNECSIRFSRNGKALNPDSTFTVNDAQAAGILKPRSGWEKYPRNMLFARAISNGFRWHCPELGGGSPLYTPEDFGRISEGEFVEATPIEDASTPDPDDKRDWLEDDSPKDPAQDMETSKPPETGEESKPEPSEVEDPQDPQQQAMSLDNSEAMTPELVKDFIAVRLEMHKNKRTHPDLIKNVAWQLGECFAGLDDVDGYRHRVMYLLFGKDSTSALTGAELMATLDWLRAKKGSDDKWHPNVLAAQEARAVAYTFEETA